MTLSSYVANFIIFSVGHMHADVTVINRDYVAIEIPVIHQFYQLHKNKEFNVYGVVLKHRLFYGDTVEKLVVNNL